MSSLFLAASATSTLEAPFRFLSSASFWRLVLPFASALLFALALTPLARAILHHFGVEDQPGGRRINKTPLTRGGGIALFLAFHLALAVYPLIAGDASPILPDTRKLAAFAIASTFLALVGLWDDVFDLNPIVKLACQAITATFLFLFGIRFGGFLPFDTPLWLNYALTLLWFVGAINAMNLIDGMDGLASGLALIASLGLAGSLFLRGSPGYAVPYLALAGACAGFLRYNFHPASVILGDCGSMFLGLALATLPILTASRNELVASLLVPLLALGVPIFDTFLALWRRSVRAALPENIGTGIKGVMQPDRSHLHHRFLDAGFSQRKVAGILYGITALLVLVGFVAIFASHHNRASGVFLLAFLVMASVVARRLDSVELWDTGRLLSTSIRRDRITQRLRFLILIAWDALSLVTAWWLAHAATRASFTSVTLRTTTLCVIGPSFLAIAFAKGYRRVWSQASLIAFVWLVAVLFLGALASGSLLYVLYGHQSGIDSRLFFYASLASLFVVGFRTLPILGKEARYVLERRRSLANPKAIRALACCGGARFQQLYREQLRLRGRDRIVIVGILQDTLILRHRFLVGHPVFGTFEDLPWVAKEQRIGLLIITEQIPSGRRKFILDTAKELGIPVIEWTLGFRRVEE